jgi:predicted nucleic acid-binding protein
MIVVDASVAVQWVLAESGSAAAAALRDEDMVAPVLWLVEAANALWRRVRTGEMTIEQAVSRIATLLNAPVAPVAIEPHIGAALKLAGELGHPVYDCLYLAVALHHDTHVVTADQRFVAAASGTNLADRVRLLGAN